MNKLALQLLAGPLRIVLSMAALLFLLAGTADYWRAWAFLAVWAGCSLVLRGYFLIYDPALMQRRMRAGPRAETTRAQKILMGLACLLFTALLSLSALDHRAHWSNLPAALSIAGDLLVVAGWTIIFLVFKENSFASATIEVAAGQQVVSTGPYAVVRHPMYAGSLLYLIGMPIALGSVWALLLVVLFLPVGVARLLNEETLLTHDLAGYAAYERRVRYRLVPSVW